MKYALTALVLLSIYVQASDAIDTVQIISAIESGEISVFETLLNNVDRNKIDAEALWVSIIESEKTAVRHAMWKIMLDYNMIDDVDLYRDSRGRTALQREVFSLGLKRRQANGDLSMLKMLLEKGADPNIKVYTHVSTLNYGPLPLEVVRMLVKYGAVPSSWDTFFQYKIFKNIDEEAESLKQKESMLLLFVEAGNVNAKDSFGRTLLHAFTTARYRNFRFMVPHLLQKGANPIILDNMEKTAIDLAFDPVLKSVMLEHVKTLDEMSTRQSCQRALSNL